MDYWYDFVSLRIGMKNILTQMTALLLVLWYSLSIIGFDVHTCHSSGRSFVRVIVENMSCEDIHPEDDCCSHEHACPCCRHEKDSEEEDGCCSDVYKVLSLTGERNSHDYISLLDMQGMNVPAIIPLKVTSFEMPSSDAGKVLLCSGDLSEPDYLSYYSVWRI